MKWKPHIIHLNVHAFYTKVLILLDRSNHESRTWETAHLPLPKANINSHFSLCAKCCFRGGEGGQFPRNVWWSPFARQSPHFFSVLSIGLALGIEPATYALRSSALLTELILPRLNKHHGKLSFCLNNRRFWFSPCAMVSSGFVQIFRFKIQDFFQTLFSKTMISFSRLKVIT